MFNSNDIVQYSFLLQFNTDWKVNCSRWSFQWLKPDLHLWSSVIQHAADRNEKGLTVVIESSLTEEYNMPVKRAEFLYLFIAIWCRFHRIWHKLRWNTGQKVHQFNWQSNSPTAKYYHHHCHGSVRAPSWRNRTFEGAANVWCCWS